MVWELVALDELLLGELVLELEVFDFSSPVIETS